jgi:hypothetical protein
MSRYSNTQTIKNADNQKTYMQSTLYPKISASNDDVYVISTSTDRLDLLASKYYGDPSMWWIIAVANNINDGTFYVDSGLQLRIPSNTAKIMNDLRNLNK